MRVCVRLADSEGSYVVCDSGRAEIVGELVVRVASALSLPVSPAYVELALVRAGGAAEGAAAAAGPTAEEEAEEDQVKVFIMVADLSKEAITDPQVRKEKRDEAVRLKALSNRDRVVLMKQNPLGLLEKNTVLLQKSVQHPHTPSGAVRSRASSLRLSPACPGLCSLLLRPPQRRSIFPISSATTPCCSAISR